MAFSSGVKGACGARLLVLLPPQVLARDADPRMNSLKRHKTAHPQHPQSLIVWAEVMTPGGHTVRLHSTDMGNPPANLVYCATEFFWTAGRPAEPCRLEHNTLGCCKHGICCCCSCCCCGQQASCGTALTSSITKRASFPFCSRRCRMRLNALQAQTKRSRHTSEQPWKSSAGKE